MLTLEQVANWAKHNLLGRYGQQLLRGDLIVTGNLYSAAGTFTPALSAATPGTLSISYTAQKGRYRKLGDVCFFNFYVATNVVTLGTASGNLRVTGLPFTAVNYSSEGYLWPARTSGVDLPSVSTLADIDGSIGAGANYAELYVVYDNAGGTAVQIAGLASGDSVSGTGWYLTA